MKIEFEIEATPQEIRAFFGLPDLAPLHEAWVERMKQYSLEGPAAEDWQKLMKSWTSGVPGINEGMDAWQKLMLAAMNPGAPRAPEKE
ncbi:MAG: hypothetical protein KGZ61_00665 [Sandarakinorhabdus sp.]|nr:hypothetical protein [Sandarakinorhabdus sp.]